MIRATFPSSSLQASDGPAGPRTIEGVAVPYGVEGRVSTGETVVFEPGSLDAAARPVALRDHDRGRPIGRVVNAVDRGDHLTATVRISRTRDGDEALVLAADEVLAAFSVGADPVDFAYDDLGVLRVRAADWQELSLLTLGAFPTARVATVTASQPHEEPSMSDVLADPAHLTDEPPDEEPDDQPDEEETEVVETRAPRVPVTAGAARRPVQPPLSLKALGPLIHAARAGNRTAGQTLQSTLGRCTVEAALTDITMIGTNNVAAMYRPAYQAEILDIVTHGSPVVNVLRQGDLTNGDFPNKTYVKWDLAPQVALQATEKAEIATSPAKLSVVSVPVQTWATGNDISRQTLDLGPPSFVEEWVRAASVDYADTIEQYAITALLAAASAVTTLVGDSFIGVVGKLYAALNPANVPAGQLFLAVSYDVSAGLIGVPQTAGPAFWGGNVNLGTYMPSSNMGGIEIIVSPKLPARTYLLGLTNAATWYDAPGVPYTLQAVNVGKLGLDIGLYGYGALAVQYAAALVKTTQP